MHSQDFMPADRALAVGAAQGDAEGVEPRGEVLGLGRRLVIVV